MTSERKATWDIPGEAPVQFSLLAPTHGTDCLDIRALGGRTGCFAYDPGFESTASCRSTITFVDGEKGELLYRGYPTEQLADHGQDASTSTVRMAGSSGANPFACVSAAIACLSGPAHGGAREACLAMLEEIGDAGRIDEFIARARDDGDSFRLIGFGHHLYRNVDPRAKLMRDLCHAVIEELGLENDRLFKVAMALEAIAIESPYFVDNKLYPNVDFYSAILQKALGIPPSMFACVSALARTAGWMAQWEEMLCDPEYKIARPRQLYTGVGRRCLSWSSRA